MFTRATIPVSKTPLGLLVSLQTPKSSPSEEKKAPPPSDDFIIEIEPTPDALVPHVSTIGGIRLPRDGRFDAFTPILSSMRSSLASEQKAVFGTSIAIVANGSGFVNAVIAVSNVAGLSEFSSYATLFGEFFVTKMDVLYQPQSIYGSWPAASTAATGQPLGVLSLHHGITAPTTLALAAPNASIKYAHTGNPWKYRWVNIDDRKARVVTSPLAGASVPTQSWCLTDSTASASYTGQVQFISPTNVGVPAATQLGNFLVKWEVYFRNRQ